MLLLNTKNIKERVKIKRLFSLETAKLRLIKQDMKIVRNRGFLTNDIGYKSVSSIQIFMNSVTVLHQGDKEIYKYKF